MIKRLLTASIAVALVPMQAHAASSFDTRSFAMGGIGVSTADYLTAPFHNPALVAKYHESDDFGLLLPSIGAAVQSDEDFISNLGDAADGIDAFLDQQYNTQEEIQSNVIDPLTGLQDSGANIRAGVGVAIAVPNETLSFNIFTQSYVNMLVRSEIDDADLDINNYTGGNYTPSSQATALGIAVTEVGAALAKSYQQSNGTLYVGVTPKVQNLTAINYTVDIHDFEYDDALDNNTTDETAFNMDLGAVYSFNNGVSVGLAGKNIFSQSIETEAYKGKSGKYTLNGVYTASTSYQNDFVTVGLDVDLNKTKNFTNFDGFINAIDAENDDTQKASIGAEFNAWNWAQLRVGYNMDIQGNLDNEVTAGIGLVPFEVFHLDLSASYAGDEQFGASLQTYFTF